MRNNRGKYIVRYIITGVIGSLIIILGSTLLIKQESTRHTTLRQPSGIADKQNNVTMFASKPGARAYNMNGLFLLELEPDSIAEIVDTITIAEEPFAVCNIIYNDMEVLNVLVKKSNLRILYDSSESILRNPQSKKRAGQLNRYTTSQSSLSTTDNPYAAEYKAAKETYREFLQKIKQLTEQMNSTTGDERILYNDEIRKLKGEDIRLANDLKTIRRKFDTWNNDHTGISTEIETAVKQPEK